MDDLCKLMCDNVMPKPRKLNAHIYCDACTQLVNIDNAVPYYNKWICPDCDKVFGDSELDDKLGLDKNL